MTDLSPQAPSQDFPYTIAPRATFSACTGFWVFFYSKQTRHRREAWGTSEPINLTTEETDQLSIQRVLLQERASALMSQYTHSHPKSGPAVLPGCRATSPPPPWTSSKQTLTPERSRSRYCCVSSVMERNLFAEAQPLTRALICQRCH